MKLLNDKCLCHIFCLENWGKYFLGNQKLLSFSLWSKIIFLFWKKCFVLTKRAIIREKYNFFLILLFPMSIKSLILLPRTFIYLSSPLKRPICSYSGHSFWVFSGRRLRLYSQRGLRILRWLIRKVRLLSSLIVFCNKHLTKFYWISLNLPSKIIVIMTCHLNRIPAFCFLCFLNLNANIPKTHKTLRAFRGFLGLNVFMNGDYQSFFVKQTLLFYC